jgi:DNA-binding MarR family transcriptional regulator
MPSRSTRPPGVASPPHSPADPSAAELRALADFRALLRKFLYFNELTADQVGLTTQRFQALLAIWAFRDAHDRDMAVGELSDALLIKDHSTAELVTRLAASGLILKAPDKQDKRKTLLRVAPDGERRMVDFARIHLRQLGEQQKALGDILRTLGEQS